MQLTDNKNIFTPANWKPGEDVLLPAPATKDAADRLADSRDPKLSSLAWYIWFMKL
jgi:peroxiredoxin (alkyl hydroperoxide reductase subunit C)